jgi:hypothetical protein
MHICLHVKDLACPCGKCQPLASQPTVYGCECKFGARAIAENGILMRAMAPAEGHSCVPFSGGSGNNRSSGGGGGGGGGDGQDWWLWLITAVAAMLAVAAISGMAGWWLTQRKWQKHSAQLQVGCMCSLILTRLWCGTLRKYGLKEGVRGPLRSWLCWGSCLACWHGLT